MREIKFRAWDKEKNVFLNLEWDDYYIDMSTGEAYEIEERSSGYMSYMDKRYLSQVVLMQYTGLKDKNGKEIYEGDILRCPEFYETREATETTYITTGYVEFKDGVWGFSDGGYLYEEYEGYDGNFEVISNIYESPSEVTP